jgi:predicted nucleic acid-binding protein
VSAGAIGLCDMVKVELLHSARNGSEFRTLRQNLTGLPNHRMSPAAWERVLDVHDLLAQVSPQHHRSVKPTDVLIAVCAEEAGWTLVHYDQDFDAIAAVTGQPTRWIAKRGSV